MKRFESRVCYLSGNANRWRWMLIGLLLQSAFLTFLAPPVWAQAPAEGVRAYREGRFADALAGFAAERLRHPEDTLNTYYLAITETQLGHYDKARALYREVQLLDPKGPAAAYARKGLSLLPASSAPSSSTDSLDPPPQTAQTPNAAALPAQDLPPLNSEEVTAPSAPAELSAGKAPASVAPVATSSPGAASTPMDPRLLQTMMMLQMGGNGGNGGNAGFNPMMLYGANGQNGTNSMDPAMMQTMMMNSLMQNMMGSGHGDN